MGESDLQPMAKPQILLADDHDDLLREVSTLLGEEFDVIGTAQDGHALLDFASRLKPDVIVTDFNMPGINGIDVASQLFERGCCKAIVLLTMYADRQLVDRALQAGISGFVLKVKAGEDLIPAIYSVLRGETYISSFESGFCII